MAQQIRYYKQDGTEYSFSKEPKIKIMQTSNADMNIGIPKKMTAVEWLEIELKKIPFINPKEAFEQAKQMEKEQMIGFYKWMKENDTKENAEKYFHYSDEDMLNEFKQNK